MDFATTEDAKRISKKIEIELRNSTVQKNNRVASIKSNVLLIYQSFCK